MSFNLIEDVKWTVIQGLTASGTTALTSQSVDMKGFDSVMFVLSCGSVSGTVTMTVQYDADSDFSGVTSLTSGSVTQSNKVYLLDLHTPSPDARYWRVSVTRSAASVIAGVYALQYNSFDKPVTQSADVSGSSKFLIG